MSYPKESIGDFIQKNRRSAEISQKDEFEYDYK